jgi:hypothetical protein
VRCAVEAGNAGAGVLYNDEGHDFWLEANRFDIYGCAARFLDSNIGAKAPKPSVADTAVQ